MWTRFQTEAQDNSEMACYSPQWMWKVVYIYLAVKAQGKRMWWYIKEIFSG